MINYLHPGTNVLPALASILVGISAVILNKYPASKRSLKKMKKKYGYTDKNKLAIADGIGYLITGIIWTSSAILRVNYSRDMNIIVLVFSIIIWIVYFWVRDKFLSKH